MNYVFSKRPTQETYRYAYRIKDIQGSKGRYSSQKGRLTTIYLEGGVYKAREKVMVRQCRICLDFKHYSSSCPDKERGEKICATCAVRSPINSRHFCKPYAHYSCHNCTELSKHSSGFVHTSHQADKNSCPLFYKKFEQRKRGTVYSPEILDEPSNWATQNTLKPTLIVLFIVSNHQKCL